MSYLVVIPKSANRQNLDITLPFVFEKSKFKEIGVCWAKGNKLYRRVGFETIRAMLDVLLPTEFDAAILYANNPEREYAEQSYSPLLASKNYAFASCGNMLTLTQAHEGCSNAEVFAKQIMRPCGKDAPNIFDTLPFHWMIDKIARQFVGFVILRNDGTIHVIHDKAFTKATSGFLYMNFEKSKSKSFISTK